MIFVGATICQRFARRGSWCISLKSSVSKYSLDTCGLTELGRNLSAKLGYLSAKNQTPETAEVNRIKGLMPEACERRTIPFPSVRQGFPSERHLRFHQSA